MLYVIQRSVSGKFSILNRHLILSQVAQHIILNFYSQVIQTRYGKKKEYFSTVKFLAGKIGV